VLPPLTFCTCKHSKRQRPTCHAAAGGVNAGRTTMQASPAAQQARPTAVAGARRSCGSPTRLADGGVAVNIINGGAASEGRSVSGAARQQHAEHVRRTLISVQGCCSTRLWRNVPLSSRARRARCQTAPAATAASQRLIAMWSMAAKPHHAVLSAGGSSCCICQPLQPPRLCLLGAGRLPRLWRNAGQSSSPDSRYTSAAPADSFIVAEI